MIALAALVMLTQGVVHVPPGKWQAMQVPVDRAGTQVEIKFQSKNEAKVQALLLTRAAAGRFHRGRSVQPICSSGFHDEARFRCRVDQPGDYVLLVDNRIESHRPAYVDVRVELQAPMEGLVRELSADRKRLVIAISIAFFGAIVLFSARQFLKYG